MIQEVNLNLVQVARDFISTREGNYWVTFNSKREINEMDFVNTIQIRIPSFFSK